MFKQLFAQNKTCLFFCAKKVDKNMVKCKKKPTIVKLK